MSGLHSILPPSSASRRVACPGSRELEAKYPEDKESPYAKEGEAAHWVASEMLKGLIGYEHVKLEQHELAPNGEPIARDMLEGASLYCSAVLARLKEDSKDVHIEEKVDISNIHPNAWGTPDVWFVRGNTLFVVDYKFGHGFVDAFENWQMISYTAGILHGLGIDGIKDQHLKVNMVIVQPRNYSRDSQVRTWNITASDLRPYFNILREAEYNSMLNGAPCNPSPECTYCTARVACQALQQTCENIMDVITANIPHDLSNHNLGHELKYMKRAAELLDARVTGLEEQAISKIKSGARIPYFRLENGRSATRWKGSDESVILAGQMFDIDLQKPIQAITPKQAIDKGLAENVVKSLSQVIPGQMKLIADVPKKIFKK